MISTVVVAGATVLYASLTYFLLREQRREKEKPRIQEIGDVVIYPLIKKLEEQKILFETGDFKWSQNGFYYKQHQLELSQGVEKLVYEEFKKNFPKIVNDIEKYGGELLKQKAILDSFANKIGLLPDFKEKVLNYFDEYKKEKSANGFFDPNIKNLGYILEDIVNNRKELRQSDGYYNFWNLYGGDLLRLRDRKELRDYKAKVENGTKDLLTLIDKILNSLLNIMSRYRADYGIIYGELRRD
jgi:hypothetical protein